MKTKGEIENNIADRVNRFQQDFLGRGSSDIRAHVVDDLIVVRLKGILTPAELHLVKADPSLYGGELIRNVRRQLIAMGRAAMVADVERITGTKVATMYHDINWESDDEIVVFALATAPQIRSRITREAQESALRYSSGA